jgi:hypothetical protein
MDEDRSRPFRFLSQRTEYVGTDGKYGNLQASIGSFREAVGAPEGVEGAPRAAAASGAGRTL